MKFAHLKMILRKLFWEEKYQVEAWVIFSLVITFTINLYLEGKPVPAIILIFALASFPFVVLDIRKTIKLYREIS